MSGYPSSPEWLHGELTTRKGESMSISKRALLVKVRVGSLGMTKSDAGAVDDLAFRNGADKSRLHVTKKVLPELATLKSLGTRISNLVRRDSYPWEDSGLRIISVKAYRSLVDEVEKMADAYNQAAEKFCSISNYHRLMEQERVALGELFKEEDYPKPEDMRAKFFVKLDVFPVPDASDDWRLNVSEEAMREVKEAVSTSIKAGVQVALNAVATQFKGLTQSILDMFEDPDRRMTRSVVASTLQALEGLMKTSLIEDEEVDKCVDRLRSTLEAMDDKGLQHMKTNPFRREKVKNEVEAQVDDLLDKMGGFL